MNKIGNQQQSIKTEETVDNYIILTSITLLASFSILMTNSTNIQKRIFICIIISASDLILALLLCLWHKIRFNLRSGIFEQEKEIIIKRYAKDIADVANTFLIPCSGHIKGEHVATSQENESNFKVIFSFCKNLGTDLKEASEKLFLKPLDEKFGKIKFIIDLSARKFRYVFFGIGLLFYFLTLCVKYKF